MVASPIEEYLNIKYGDWVVFILGIFIMNILILNSLIAILGDSYDKVQQDRKLYESERKLPLLIELNAIFSLCRSKSGEKKYLHLFTYTEESNVVTDEWAGRVKQMEKIINKTNLKNKVEFIEKMNSDKQDILRKVTAHVDEKI